LEARARGHKLFYHTPDKLSLRDGQILAEAAPLDVRDVKGDHFTLGEASWVDLAVLDIVLLRQHPPFNITYITSTHLLEHLKPKVTVVNDPASVRNAPQKLFVMNFPQLMPPTLITRSKAAIVSFQDQNFGSLYDLFAASFREPWVVQRFLPQITRGDKRIILVDGEPAGALNRIPSENDIRANMVRGAKPRRPRSRHANARFAP
jgi:glutathione synthase